MTAVYRLSADPVHVGQVRRRLLSVDNAAGWDEHGYWERQGNNLGVKFDVLPLEFIPDEGYYRSVGVVTEVLPGERTKDWSL